MAVKMRLTRMGDKKSPFYRVVVIDSRKAQSGEYIDKIGYVNPLKPPQKSTSTLKRLSPGLQRAFSLPKRLKAIS